VVYTRVLTCFTEKPSAIFGVHGLALLHRETQVLTARGWGELGGEKYKRASAAGLINQRNGCASKVKVNQPTPEHKGRGKEKPCCFLVPGSILDLIP
jgi:hypothetical protein